MNFEKEPQMKEVSGEEWGKCPCTNGYLPPCAPLAQSYVPYQQENSQRYDQKEALEQGTLFPGLNLPFYKSINGEKLPATPLTELQALGFVLTELGLYLDSHPEDEEAFMLFRQYAALEKKAKAQYELLHGPLTQCKAAEHKAYKWVRGPWPWEIGGND